MRAMALDYGERRIGVAISDRSRCFAQPLCTLERPKRGRWDPYPELVALIREHEVDAVVVGLPLNMDGSAGEACERSRAFGAKVESRSGVTVEFLDERWTSVEAERRMAESGASSRNRRGRVDPVAAAILLSTWLERGG